MSQRKSTRVNVGQRPFTRDRLNSDLDCVRQRTEVWPTGKPVRTPTRAGARLSDRRSHRPREAATRGMPRKSDACLSYRAKCFASCCFGFHSSARLRPRVCWGSDAPVHLTTRPPRVVREVSAGSQVHFASVPGYGGGGGLIGWQGQASQEGWENKDKAGWTVANPDEGQQQFAVKPLAGCVAELRSKR